MNEQDKLREWCKGDADAVRFLTDIIEIVQIGDDLVDLDKPIERAASMGRLLHLCLVSVPANPFFIRYQGWLAPLISSAILAWQGATRWEKQSDETLLAFAFVYRDLLDLLVIQVAMLIGGRAWAELVQEDVIRYVHFIHPDGQSFLSWKDEVNA